MQQQINAKMATCNECKVTVDCMTISLQSRAEIALPKLYFYNCNDVRNQTNPATNGTHNGVNLTALWDMSVLHQFLQSQQPNDGNTPSILQPEPFIDKMLM